MPNSARPRQPPASPPPRLPTSTPPSPRQAPLLYLLQRRLKNGDIYTWAGDVLISLNPYAPIASLYQALALSIHTSYPWTPTFGPPAPCPLAPAPYPWPYTISLDELSFFPSRPSFPLALTPHSSLLPLPLHLALQVSTFLDGGAAAVASPHVYAISKRAQQVSETTLYTPLYLTAPYTPYTRYTPCIPYTPSHLTVSSHIRLHPLTGIRDDAGPLGRSQEGGGCRGRLRRPVGAHLK